MIFQAFRSTMSKTKIPRRIGGDFNSKLLTVIAAIAHAIFAIDRLVARRLERKFRDLGAAPAQVKLTLYIWRGARGRKPRRHHLDGCRDKRDCSQSSKPAIARRWKGN